MPPAAGHVCLPEPATTVHTRAGALPRAGALLHPEPTAGADAAALLRDLQRLSRVSSIDASRVSFFSTTHEYGVGATLNALVLAVLDSLGRNHTLFAPKLVLWSDPARCARTDLSCFFASLPSLDATMAAAAVGGRQKIAVRGLTAPRWRRFLDDWFGAGSAHALPTEQPAAMRSLEAYSRASRLREAEIIGRLPPRYARHGRFWLIAQALHFLTRPNAALRHQLQRERAALGMHAHQPVLGLHVRKGDACTHRGECRGLAAFMPDVRRVAKAYGITAVFLATPSAEVKAETARFPEFTWLFRNGSRVRAGRAAAGAAAHASGVESTAAANVGHDEGDTLRALRAGGHVRIEDGLLSRRVHAVDEWRSAMIDLYLLAECQALIGAFSSSLARLALALNAGGAGGCLKPYLSVDIDWCFGFLRGGAEVIHRGHELLGAGVEPMPSRTRDERDEAARRVRESGLTC